MSLLSSASAMLPHPMHTRLTWGGNVALIAGLLGKGQFLDQTALGEHAQGRINGGQGHRGEVLLDALVDLLHGGMVGGVEKPPRRLPNAAA